LLELIDVTAGYGSHTVLRHVNLVVPDGAVVALLGANGVGKTTLLRVASGLIAPTSGRILIDGEDLTGARPEDFATRGVCHIPEGRGIYRGLSVFENLRLQAPASRNRQLIGVALERFPRLKDRLSQRAGTLSGGEQQMLAMTRAYLADVEVLFVDELSMGLAPKIVDDIYGHLAQLASQRVAMLVVEQYVRRALELADVVYILRNGQVMFVGEPGELADEGLLTSYLGEAV
jgi:branched-chain amino acid transport system ATP-binding protein